MWPIVALLALAGCNQVFGLRETINQDGGHEFFDAMLDAPFSCPSVGNAPQFSPSIHQINTQNCYGYSTSRAADLGAAICNIPSYAVMTGPADMMLTPAQGISRPDTSTVFAVTRLSPEGDRLYAQTQNGQTMTVRFMVFAHQTNDTWTVDPDVAIAPLFNEFPWLVGVTARPSAHLLVIRTYKLHEYVSDDAGSWTPLPMYTDNELGVVPYEATMTEDGLHLLIHGSSAVAPITRGMYYADRQSLSGRFGKAVRIDSLPMELNDPFMSAACERVYFSGFGSLFYIQQS